MTAGWFCRNSIICCSTAPCHHAAASPHQCTVCRLVLPAHRDQPSILSSSSSSNTAHRHVRPLLTVQARFRACLLDALSILAAQEAAAPASEHGQRCSHCPTASSHACLHAPEEGAPGGGPCAILLKEGHKILLHLQAFEGLRGGGWPPVLQCASQRAPLFAHTGCIGTGLPPVLPGQAAVQPALVCACGDAVHGERRARELPQRRKQRRTPPGLGDLPRVPLGGGPVVCQALQRAAQLQSC